MQKNEKKKGHLLNQTWRSVFIYGPNARTGLVIWPITKLVKSEAERRVQWASPFHLLVKSVSWGNKKCDWIWKAREFHFQLALSSSEPVTVSLWFWDEYQFSSTTLSTCKKKHYFSIEFLLLLYSRSWFCFLWWFSHLQLISSAFQRCRLAQHLSRLSLILRSSDGLLQISSPFIHRSFFFFLKVSPFRFGFVLDTIVFENWKFCVEFDTNSIGHRNRKQFRGVFGFEAFNGSFWCWRMG